MRSSDYEAVREMTYNPLEVCERILRERAASRPITTHPLISRARETRARDSYQRSSPDRWEFNEIKYRPVCSRSDLLGAFALLQNRYEAAGLAESMPSRTSMPSIRMMPYHGWYQSQVFVAAMGRRIVGTVTLIRDGQNCLPISENYRREIQSARAIGRVGEITSLAVDPVHPKPTEVFGQLTRLLTFFARYHRMDYLAATVHPRHAKFYQNAMGFRVIGDEIQCDHVAGKPGVAVLGSVNNASDYRDRWKDYYFTGRFTRDKLLPRPMTIREFYHCHSLVEQQRLDKEAGLDYLGANYPSTRCSAYENGGLLGASGLTV